jgi:hypothetical protein
MILRYIPPLTSKHKAFITISYFLVLLGLILLHNEYGKIVMLLFSFGYAIMMILTYFSLTRRHFIKLDTEKNTLTVHRLLSKKRVQVQDISVIDVVETDKAYILSIEAKGLSRSFSLSGSISFEEPPFVAFLRAIHKMKPDVGLSDICIELLHGTRIFTPWSRKMYVAYWTYIIIMISYYILLLAVVNIVT